MIFGAFGRLRDKGVLGMNRRNAEYIMRCNPRSSYPVVDNKLLTRRLAEAHQVPVPPLYHVVEYHGDIGGLRKALEERRSFVLKPARGVGGSGIVLIADQTREGFVTQSGEVLAWTDLAYHLSDILSGIYSLGGLEDQAIVEALLQPEPVFAAVTYEGVPDVRIVLYRGVPVMGMVRLPTKASDGKANLHRGAIGAGIEVSSGRTLGAVYRSEVVTTHPDTGRQVAGIQVPYWKDILLMAAKSSDMTGLGYVAVDMVIDRKLGPVLLEMNARPGLAIQLANMAGLMNRLEKIDSAPSEIFGSPETRAEWAIGAFSASFVP